jgi:uroporphyrinogen-III synthase
MRLLVTRPALDAVGLADILAAQGHDVLISPMIEIELNAVALPKADGHGGLALTSANGVRALMAHLAQLPQRQRDHEMAQWHARPAFAVGPQTALALQEAGFGDIHQADGALAALVALIAARYKEDLPLLHIAGRDRAGDLVSGLGEKDIACHRTVLYRAEAATDFTPAAAAALGDAHEPVEGVVIYSQRSADIFCALYARLEKAGAFGIDVGGDGESDSSRTENRTLTRPKAFCLSEMIAATMRQAGFEAVAPPAPDSYALLAMLPLSRD